MEKNPKFKGKKGLDQKLKDDDKVVQRAAQSSILDGKQERLRFNPISDQEHKKQIANAKARKITA